jgi:hypothetical protein
MSTAIAEPEVSLEVLKMIREASPAVQAVALEELVRIHRRRYDNLNGPLFVWNSEGLVIELLIPAETPFDPNAHMKEPGYEESIRREMEEVIRREGPPIRLH